ncbi:MAG: 4-hydroxy-tetrahydrodipicolinate reductase [Acholeplasmatales bacterium]|nr:4-hydroxy-tetrahydrodipicolinate reductase [Acholeplasmatales bacterium]
MQVALVGYGAMNKLVEEELISKGHTISGIVALDQLSNLNEITKPFDLIVDFSSPACLDMNLEYATKNKKALVIATTGYTEEQRKKIFEASKIIPICCTANFSLGVTVLKRVCAEMAEILKNDFDMEIVEKHHNKKVDAPSGTALALLEAIDPNNEFKHVFGRNGYSKREHEIGINAVRGGTIVGEHSVIFAGTDEVLEFKHEAFSKKIFSKGAVKAAEYILGKEPKIYTMEDVLF